MEPMPLVNSVGNSLILKMIECKNFARDSRKSFPVATRAFNQGYFRQSSNLG